MQYQQTRNKLLQSSEFLVAITSAIFGSLGVWYIYSLGLVTELTDSFAHLNFSRLFFESLTPGISQIGFWPPLLHILMAPFTMVPALYGSGLAGAIVLIPFYILGTVYTYKLVKLFTEHEILAWLGAVMFMVNPYILYYSATPMMEVLFLGNLMAAAYYMALWFSRGQLFSLILTAVFVTLAALSRFEGLLLVPLVGVILAIDLFRKRKEYQQVQAVVILFMLIAVIGPLVILSYSWFFGDSPLAFTGGSWIKSAAVTEGFLTKGSFIESARYFLHASYYMIGQNLMIFSLICLPLLALISRKRFETFSVLLVLASPMIFIVIALTSGSYNIGLPELAPGKIFLNERYGLSWIGFMIVAPLMLLGAVMKYASGRKLFNYAAKTAVVLGAMTLLYSSLDFLYVVAKEQEFFVIRNNINSPRSHQQEMAMYLKDHYDYGKVLITRSDNDPVLAVAGIPLNEYIYEANYLYFDQAIDEPWIFSRWVVMNNVVGDGQGTQTDDLISQKWGGNEQFDYFYELAHENSGRMLYKVKEDRVAQYAQENNLNVANIPSLNRNMEKWDPANFYDDLRVGYDVKKN